MLAGLLFATHDTEDRPDQLTATLPFGGVTLIEYQARLLVAAGCTQIIILVARLTPELLGAIARIGRRGVAVDAVRYASEAVEKLHPLARVLMLADGLITTKRIVATLAGEGGDALLVVPQPDASRQLERLGGDMAWAGVARLDPRRLAEVARLPRDYDAQSTLLRVAEQARAAHVLLPPDAVLHGHGIEHDGVALAARGRVALAAIVSDRRGWFDRYCVAPLARLTLPAMVERRWPGAAVGGVGGALGLGGLTLVATGWSGTGVALALIGCLVLALAAALSEVRDEPGVERGVLAVARAMPDLTLLLLGAKESGQAGDPSAIVLALVLVVMAALAGRAGPERVRAIWWGSGPAYLAIVLLATLAGSPMIGLALAATLTGAIERLRAALAAL